MCFHLDLAYSHLNFTCSPPWLDMFLASFSLFSACHDILLVLVDMFSAWYDSSQFDVTCFHVDLTCSQIDLTCSNLVFTCCSLKQILSTSLIFYEPVYICSPQLPKVNLLHFQLTTFILSEFQSTSMDLFKLLWNSINSYQFISSLGSSAVSGVLCLSRFDQIWLNHIKLDEIGSDQIRLDLFIWYKIKLNKIRSVEIILDQMRSNKILILYEIGWYNFR